MPAFAPIPSFHELLRHHRTTHGFSYQQLAERAWTTPSFVFRVCKGEAKPGFNIVLRLAIAMSLSVEDTDELVRAAGYLPLLEFKSPHPAYKNDQVEHSLEAP